MKALATTLFIFSFINVFSQMEFAVVKDKDGYVNIREKGIKNSRIINQLPSGQLIYLLENTKNWTYIEYQNKKGESATGYIYKDRYELISNLPKLPVLKKKDNSILLGKKKIEVEVEISQKKFNKKEHQFQYVKNSNHSLIELIDGKKYWGTDGELPKTQFKKITYRIGKKENSLPKEALEGLYQPSFHHVNVNYNKTNQTIYIHSVNSDGAGSYEVVWKIENGAYKDRLVVHGF